MSDQKPSIAPQELEAMEKLLTNVQSQLGPSAEFTARMQKRLERHYVLMQERTHSEGSKSSVSRGFFSFLSTRAYSVLTAFAFVIFTGGLSTFAYTSDSVTNGNALYPIKRGLESIEKTFSGTPEAQAEYQMKLLSRRLAESRFLTLRGVVDEPTNQEVTLVVNDGIQAIQAVQQADYRDQLLDRITSLLVNEETRIYNTAGVPVPVTQETSDESLTSPTDSTPVLPLDSSSTTSVRADTTSSRSTESDVRASIQQLTPPSDNARSTSSDKQERPKGRIESRDAPSQVTTPTDTSSEENIAIPLHVRPGVIDALQKNREHLKRIEVRITEMRRQR